MTFQQLVYLVEISRCGSINKAAQKLFLSQSGISASVRELEEELGIQFFTRSNRGVEFTPEGREFLGYAQTLLERKRYVEEIYRGGGRNAPVLFSVSTQRYPFSEDAFIRLINDTRHEAFSFVIKSESMETVIKDVYQRTSDIGVLFMSNLSEKIINKVLRARDVEFTELRAIPPCVFVRPGHPLAQKTSIRPEEIDDYTYLAFEHEQGIALDFSEEVNLIAFHKPRRVITVNDRATAVNVIAGTDAVTTGSGLLVEELMDTRMISIPLDTDDSMHLGWIKPKGVRLSQEAQRFIALLEQSIDRALVYTEKVRKELLQRSD